LIRYQYDLHPEPSQLGQAQGSLPRPLHQPAGIHFVGPGAVPSAHHVRPALWLAGGWQVERAGVRAGSATAGRHPAMTDQTADQLLDRYLYLRDHLDAQDKAFKEWAKPFRDEMEKISAQVHEMLLALGGDRPKLATGSGTAYFQTTRNPSIMDRDAFLKFVGENWNTFGNAMLQLRAPQVTALDEYMQAHDGELPPGVKLSPNTAV